jgi:peptidoglycan/LPS O-acetylase OafA/YrhL
LLCNFLTDKQINKRLDKIFSHRLVNYICVVGYCSYAIYLFHMLVHRYIASKLQPIWFSFLVYFFGSIFIGMVLSKTFEKWVLNYRDRWFPKKTQRIPASLKV